MMWGREIGNRLAEKCMRNTADLGKVIRFILEWIIRYFVGRQAYNTCSNSPILALRFVLLVLLVFRSVISRLLFIFLWVAFIRRRASEASLFLLGF